MFLYMLFSICCVLPHTAGSLNHVISELFLSRAGEHRTPDFTKLNPMQKVPVMVDNGFILTERYMLKQTNNLFCVLLLITTKQSFPSFKNIDLIIPAVCVFML